MKKAIVTSALCLAVASSAFAALSKDEAKRLSEAATILNDLKNAPDQVIPENVWNRAQCVIVIPSVKMVGLGVGG